MDPGRRLRLLRPPGPGVRPRPGGRRAAVRRRTHRADTGPRPRAPGESAVEGRVDPRRRHRRQRQNDRHLERNRRRGQRHGGQPGTRGRRRGGRNDRAGPRPGRRGAARGPPRGHRRRSRQIARQAPGVAVARAHAAVGDHPGYPCTLVPAAMSVYVVPDAPRGDGDWDRPNFVPRPPARSRPAEPGPRHAVRGPAAGRRAVHPGTPLPRGPAAGSRWPGRRATLPRSAGGCGARCAGSWTR